MKTYVANVKNTHDDAMKWKYFSYFWLILRGIHRPSIYFLNKWPVIQSFDFFVNLNTLLDKQ